MYLLPTPHRVRECAGLVSIPDAPEWNVDLLGHFDDAVFLALDKGDLIRTEYERKMGTESVLTRQQSLAVTRIVLATVIMLRFRLITERILINIHEVAGCQSKYRPG